MSCHARSSLPCWGTADICLLIMSLAFSWSCDKSVNNSGPDKDVFGKRTSVVKALSMLCRDAPFQLTPVSSRFFASPFTVLSAQFLSNGNIHWSNRDLNPRPDDRSERRVTSCSDHQCSTQKALLAQYYNVLHEFILVHRHFPFQNSADDRGYIFDSNHITCMALEHQFSSRQHQPFVISLGLQLLGHSELEQFMKSNQQLRKPQ